MTVPRGWCEGNARSGRKDLRSSGVDTSGEDPAPALVKPQAARNTAAMGTKYVGQDLALTGTGEQGFARVGLARAAPLQVAFRHGYRRFPIWSW